MSGLDEAPVTDKPYRLMWGEYVDNKLVHQVYFQPFASWEEAMRTGNHLLGMTLWSECEFTIIKVVSKTMVAGTLG